MEKIIQDGDRVVITWLPKNNAFPDENCYIGSLGTVTEMQPDNSFVLVYENGSKLLVGANNKVQKITYG